MCSQEYALEVDLVREDKSFIRGQLATKERVNRARETKEAMRMRANAVSLNPVASS